MSVEKKLTHLYRKIIRTSLSTSVQAEIKHRVLDTLGCFYGGFLTPPAVKLRLAFATGVQGEASLWGTRKKLSADLAVWLNGTCVRSLDFNDTYLSLEPCHPSDLIASLWAACELSNSKHQGRDLIKGILLAYEVMCRLCDSASIRKRGWDHVTYLPIASAMGCSLILGLNEKQMLQAVALAINGQIAMRQTRVGYISDWKASCAAYAAKAGLWATRAAQKGFTGPNEVFSGKMGFFNQVSGKFNLSMKKLGHPWMIFNTHVKYYPAEHHAQSAIEAVLGLRQSHSFNPAHINRIDIDCFQVAVDIIGHEKEKWQPTTRETADHSMPYLVCAALLDGYMGTDQFEQKRYMDRDVVALMKKVRVRSDKKFSKSYPKQMPTRVTIHFKNRAKLSQTIHRPKGYSGRPLTKWEFIEKFDVMASKFLSGDQRQKLMKQIDSLDRVKKLSDLTNAMVIS